MSKNSIQDRIKKHAADNAVEKVNLEGVGAVYIRRLKTNEILDISNVPDNQSGPAFIVACVCEADGSPVFDSPDAVGELDWPLAQSLMEACQRVNSLQIVGRGG